jgi:hypothetical protein
VGLVAFAAVGVIGMGVRSLARGERGKIDPRPLDASSTPKAAPPVTGNRPVAPSPPGEKAADKGPSYASVLIRDVPHVRQKPDFCGEACAAMWLAHLGRAVDQDWVYDQSGLDPVEGRGCYTPELAAALTKIGFRIGPVWHKLPAAKAAETLDALFGEMHADLAAGVPSIVCMHYDRQPGTTEHFRLVLGYDAKSDEVIYHEPAEDRGSLLRMKRAEFLALWPLKSGPRESMAIRLRLESGELLPGRAAATFTAADYAQHIMSLKKKLPGEGFTLIVQPPFVVIGDDKPEQVRRSATGTVQWAVAHLKAAYFPSDPAEILDIWLFKDKESYERNCRKVFKSDPTTPYGYFSHADKALVMNIATGGGTLVHEIVHPFMAANFPGCPAWLNEGLGSLYEQCGEKEGRIAGYTNWRLAGLQEAIRKKRVPAFKDLCGTTDREFYSEDRGTNYAQARYLCYYLQEQGLLQKFYRQFRASAKKDPTGYESLKAVLGRDDDGMRLFQREWEAAVLKLRFPES